MRRLHGAKTARQSPPFAIRSRLAYLFLDEIKDDISLEPVLIHRSEKQFETIRAWLNNAMFVLFVAAVASLILDYGFYLVPEAEQSLEYVDLAIFALFVLQQLIKLLYVPRRWPFLRERWFEYLLTVVLFLLVISEPVARDWYNLLASKLGLKDIGKLFIVVIQVTIALNIISSALRYSRKLSMRNIQPARIFLASFAILVLLGTALLLLPRATTSPISLVDAFFTATSAVCVTGLIVVDTATRFSPLGQAIIMVLIQIGGLGLMTFTTFFALFAGNLGVKERVMIGEFLNEVNLDKIKRTIFSIILLTVAFEALGSLMIYNSWGDYPFASDKEKLLFSVFHSISAFCNAGFSLFSNGLNTPGLRENIPLVMEFAILIILGGLGFSVLSNFYAFKVHHYRKFRVTLRLTVHTKIVLMSTAFFIVGGTLLFFFLESSNTAESLTFGQKLSAAFFQSVTTRTAGFNTVNIGALLPATAFFMIIWMFIGASPGGTGGGVKTTTVSLVAIAAWNTVMGRTKVEAFKRTIASQSVLRAYAAITFGILTLLISIFLLLMTESRPVLDIIFEAVSAFGTVGLSRGITADLTIPGKLIIIFTMFVGRVGPLTLALALSKFIPEGRYDYPSEHVYVA